MNGLVLWNVVVGAGDCDCGLIAAGGGGIFGTQSVVASDFDRDCIVNDGARLGAGDAFFTISVNHCSAFGSGFVTSIGTL